MSYAIVFENQRPVLSDYESLTNTIQQAIDMETEDCFKWSICEVIDNEGMDWVDLENPIYH
jgi:hypothetical protein